MTRTAFILALAPLAIAAAPPANVDPKVAAQVPLIAEKLKGWRGAWGAVDGKLGCKTVTSTGDKAIDVIGCAALIECITPAYPELKAIADGKDAQDAKKQKMGARLAALNPCLSEKRGLGIARLALQRARAGA